MSILNKNMSIKITASGLLRWEACEVNVAPRSFNTLVYRLKGSGTLSGKDFSIESNPGDVFFMPKDTPYFAKYHSYNEVLFINFYSDIESLPENFSTPHDTKELFKKLSATWDKKDVGYGINCLSIFCDIIKVLTNHAFPKTKSKSEELFEKAFLYIKENFKNPDLTIDEVIAPSGISGTYFRRLFAEKTGCSPTEYLTSERLKFAEQLLLAGNYSISEAAIMSGFSDSNYFSRVVKREYGVPPSKLYKHR